MEKWTQHPGESALVSGGEEEFNLIHSWISSCHVNFFFGIHCLWESIEWQAALIAS